MEWEKLSAAANLVALGFLIGMFVGVSLGMAASTSEESPCAKRARELREMKGTTNE